jgi:unsaturated rhamnogalacturonyl hydrolase
MAISVLMQWRTIRCLGLAGALTGAFAGRTAADPGETTMSRRQIIAQGEELADSQLAELAGKKPDIGWNAAVMWAGYAEFSHLSSKPIYSDAVQRMGDEVHWTPLFRPKFPNHADDLCIGQTFLDAYATKTDPVRIAATQKRVNAASEAIDAESPRESGSKTQPLTWYWCDSLFMEPAVHARLSVITQNQRYIDAMDKEWWRTAALLYDPQAHLFFRDKSFLKKLAANGKPVFWSRGNGWVFAGLARMLTFMPQNYPSRPRYVSLFKDLAAALAPLQQTDGTWRSSLLDPDQYPDSETSGTALDCYAYAWGINQGLLGRAVYLPAICKAWGALLAARRPDGLLGYVQGVAKSPGFVKADGTQFYATGAFLLDVCEISRLAPIAVPEMTHLEIRSVNNGAATTQAKDSNQAGGASDGAVIHP